MQDLGALSRVNLDVPAKQTMHHHHHQHLNGMDMDDGGPFRVPDLWQKSAFTLSDSPEESLFSDIQPELSLISHDFTADLRLPDIESFQFGRFEDITAPEASNPEESLVDSGSTASEINEDNFWQLDVTKPKDGGLRTWKAFLGQEHPKPGVANISEAGPRTFDALQDESSNVLQSGFFLKCLAMLGLGRSSALFQWDAKELKFVPTISDIRLSGFSLKSSASLVKQLSVTGTAFAELRSFVDKTYAAKRPLAARVALATCIQVIIEALDQNLADHVFNSPTAIQLLAHFETPGQVLYEMRALMKVSARQDTDVAVLSAIRQEIERLERACSPFHNIHLDIMDRVAQPWVYSISRNTGLLHGDMNISTDAYTADETLSEHTGLISASDAEQVIEITTGLAILKDASPDHPLLLPASWGVGQPQLERSSTQVDVDSIFDRAKQYQNDLLEAIACYDGGMRHPQRPIHHADRQDMLSEQLPWTLDEGQQEYFEAIGNQFFQSPLKIPDTARFGLRANIAALAGTAEVTGEDELDLRDTDTTPLQHLQPYLQVQSRLVNGSILRLLFRDFDLRKHINLQHSFHLFGNGVFVHRLTNALFSSESHTAERQRGQAIGGVNLGLRLDSRETRKWPPASSELRLGLMGVLTDAWALPEELPGGLSFSIRELDDTDIERVLDPHSIYALDFLRLRYEAPAPLDVVITPDSMQKYDDVFRVLLRILRMVHVVTLLRRSAALEDSTQALQAFAHDAHHAITAISSHMFDMGITVPWSHFNSNLDTLESNLSLEDASKSGYGSIVSMGIQGLRILHEDTIDTMRSRLFLRARHSRLRDSVDAILDTVLSLQRLLVEGGGTYQEEDIWEWRSILREQIKVLLSQLTDLGRKLSKRTIMGETDREDAIAAEMLRWRLDTGLGLSMH